MNELQEIIKGGYCIGCGACAVPSEGSISIRMNQFGMYEADPSGASSVVGSRLTAVLKTCPFSNQGPNEDDLGDKLFNVNCAHDNRIGYHRDLYIGYSAERDLRKNGSSGGLITWTLSELFRLGHIDAVAHVKAMQEPEDKILFRYAVSHSKDEIEAGAKSRYYPIELSEVLMKIKKSPGRYAIVGLPCFIKAVRRLAKIDPILNERIIFYIGLVCGHLKSKSFADSYGWQVGISPGHLEEIDFRVKLPGRSAGNYGVSLRGNGKSTLKPSRDFLGSTWGHNYFRYPACDFCDDVFAETADLAVGDAWLPNYEHDHRGNSIAVVRNSALATIFSNAKNDGRLALDYSSADEIAESQAGGIRDRRDGLAYRLFMRRQEGAWTPQKRVQPRKAHLPRDRCKVYQARSEAMTGSHKHWLRAVECNDLQIFKEGMQSHIRKIQKSYRPIGKKILNRLIKLRDKILGTA